MRVFPRINYRRLGAKGGRRPHKSRAPIVGRARAEPRTFLLIIPPLLLAACVIAFVYAGPGALFALAVATGVFAAAQGIALRRASRRRPLQFSLQEGEDRRFLSQHNPPLLVRKDYDPSYSLDLGGPVLGIFEGFRYEQGAVPLRQHEVRIPHSDLT